ncbi:hypothetical protein C8Q75DRAFT_735603 [Abortiporus biennis]|nr:hypothetical protein C8Q75DRAFT_735603 [Abortiporus biennis]
MPSFIKKALLSFIPSSIIGLGTSSKETQTPNSNINPQNTRKANKPRSSFTLTISLLNYLSPKPSYQPPPSSIVTPHVPSTTTTASSAVVTPRTPLSVDKYDVEDSFETVELPSIIVSVPTMEEDMDVSGHSGTSYVSTWSYHAPCGQEQHRHLAKELRNTKDELSESKQKIKTLITKLDILSTHNVTEGLTHHETIIQNEKLSHQLAKFYSTYPHQDLNKSIYYPSSSFSNSSHNSNRLLQVILEEDEEEAETRFQPSEISESTSDPNSSPTSSLSNTSSSSLFDTSQISIHALKAELLSKTVALDAIQMVVDEERKSKEVLEVKLKKALSTIEELKKQMKKEKERKEKELTIAKCDSDSSQSCSPLSARSCSDYSYSFCEMSAATVNSPPTQCRRVILRPVDNNIV